MISPTVTNLPAPEPGVPRILALTACNDQKKRKKRRKNSGAGNG